MTNKKSTKRALLASVLALLLSFAMLLGTTYAWFTDSVTSGSNVIQTGNLDIEVEYTLDGKTWNDLAGADDLFQKGSWEPGHTEVVALKVSNNGSLALKYTAQMNIVDEIIGKSKTGNDIILSEILTVSTLTQQANDAMGVGDITLALAFKGENSVGYQSTAAFKDANVLEEARELHPGDSHYVFVKVDMAETVGNEANHDGVNVPTIKFGINVFATQFSYENDSFGNNYDANVPTPIVVSSAEEAQAVLNTLESGSIIQLMPGVDYGTLEVSAQVVSENKKPVANNNNTKAVDYFTTKYPTGEFVRKFDNITIVGAPGAKVDGIKFVTGTFKVDIPETGKQSGTMYRWVEINNLVIDGVEFTDKSTLGAAAGWVSPIFMDLQSVKVNGLTVKNCTLEGNKSNMNFVYAYGSAAKDCDFGITLNDVVIANNTVSGIARLCELRDANNVSITGNTVKNITRELALLANNTGSAYSGTVQIVGNNADNVAIDYTADGYNALFVRVGVGGDANVVVKDNVITNTTPIDVNDFVKVTEHTGVLTVENNILN